MITHIVTKLVTIGMQLVCRFMFYNLKFNSIWQPKLLGDLPIRSLIVSKCIWHHKATTSTRNLDQVDDFLMSTFSVQNSFDTIQMARNTDNHVLICRIFFFFLFSFLLVGLRFLMVLIAPSLLLHKYPYYYYCFYYLSSNIWLWFTHDLAKWYNRIKSQIIPNCLWVPSSILQYKSHLKNQLVSCIFVFNH